MALASIGAIKSVDIYFLPTRPAMCRGDRLILGSEFEAQRGGWDEVLRKRKPNNFKFRESRLFASFSVEKPVEKSFIHVAG
jgi:hypothetical protein